MFFVLVLGGGLGMIFFVMERCSGGGAMDVFAEEKRKTFRPTFQHLKALTEWVDESGLERENEAELEDIAVQVRRLEASLVFAKNMKAALGGRTLLKKRESY